MASTSTSSRVSERATVAKRLLAVLWAGIAIQIAGRALDGIWHANNEGFESASDQLQAHWLLWLGVATTLAGSAVAISRVGEARRGWAAVFAASAAYLAAALWHFLEHAASNDPAAAHILLGILWVALLIAAVVTTLDWRRTRGGAANGGAEAAAPES